MKKLQAAAKHAATMIEVRESGVHGRGVFAVGVIRKSALIGVYAGRRYAAEDIGTREWDIGLTYVFALSDGAVIDANEGGNDTRFINHACEPNCVAYEVETASGLAIEIRALRRLERGEELSLDYGLDIADNEPSLYACLCGSPRCRGTMRTTTEEQA